MTRKIDAKANASMETGIKETIGIYEIQVTLLPPCTAIAVALGFCCQLDAES